MHKCLPSS